MVLWKKKSQPKRQPLSLQSSHPHLKIPLRRKGASQSQELVLVTLPFTAKEDSKGKGIAQAIMPKTTAKTAAKTNPPSKTK